MRLRWPFPLLLAIFAVFVTSASVRASGVLPAEKLLPPDTFLLWTIPDMGLFRTNLAVAPAGRLWKDPSLQAFRHKLHTNFTAEFVLPLEQDLGLKMTSFTHYAQGQVTLAVVREGWQPGGQGRPRLVFLLDARERAGDLRAHLGKIREKWVRDGRAVGSTNIGGTEFMSVQTPASVVFQALARSLAPTNAIPAAPLKVIHPMMVGVVGTMLVVTDSSNALHRITARLSGGLVETLSTQAAWESSQDVVRDGHLQVWIDPKPVVEVLRRSMFRDSPVERQAGEIDPNRAFNALGFSSMRSVGGALRFHPDGAHLQLHLGVPAAAREGIFKLFALEALPSAPGPFIPFDAVSHTRFRMSLPRTWEPLVALLMQVSPQTRGGLDLILGAAGKDKDPNYDLKKELLTHLGDDVIIYDKPPPQGSSTNISVYLFGSGDPPKLASAVRYLALMLGNVQEREFMGGTVYSLLTPLLGDSDDKPGVLHFGAGPGYVGFSSDSTALEEFLRSGETRPRSLTEVAPIASLAPRVGGSESGMFSVTNDREALRRSILAARQAAARGEAPEPTLMSLIPGFDLASSWADLTLLPAPEALAAHLFYSVTSTQVRPDGILIRRFISQGVGNASTPPTAPAAAK